MCHNPSSYVFEADVGCTVVVVVVEDDSGARPGGNGAPSAGIVVSIGAIESGINVAEVTGKTVEVTITAWADNELDAGGLVEVKVGVEEVRSMVVKAVEVCVINSVVDNDKTVLSASTTGYKGFEDAADDCKDGDNVAVKSLVTLTLMVSAGSDMLTTAVETITSVEGGSVTVGAVTVSVWSKVWIIVVAADILGSEDVAAEPPSTATTE